MRGYRGGYLPLSAARSSAGLRDGRVRGVVGTNALELGIDIGGLDAADHASGYPGTIAATWQQIGRAGRRASDVSLAILVAACAPLDQFVAAAPRLLLRHVAGARR